MVEKRKWKKKELIEFETKLAEMFKRGEINCPIHLSGGNEQMLLGLFDMIKPQDYVFATHRNHYHYLLKGGKPEVLLAEIKGEKEGCCGGNGRSMHLYDKKLNFYTSAIVGGNIAMAVGVGLGIKKEYTDKPEDKSKPHVWCFMGDGAEDTGAFVEAARFVSARVLPVTFVVEDNDFAVETTKKERWHNYMPIGGQCILRYQYVRRYPHVGVGEHVSM